MADWNVKERLVRKLRSGDEPAMSAARLAEELDVSVRTVNNHINDLVSADRIKTTQIGNATAYYVPFEDYPAHEKPDHTCARCGREVNTSYDFAKVEQRTYFDRGGLEPGTADFFIFCRFCSSDFVSWVLDPAAEGEYPFVDKWHIPEEQLDEVKSDPDIVTEYVE